MITCSANAVVFSLWPLLPVLFHSVLSQFLSTSTDYYRLLWKWEVKYCGYNIYSSDMSLHVPNCSSRPDSHHGQSCFIVLIVELALQPAIPFIPLNQAFSFSTFYVFRSHLIFRFTQDLDGPVWTRENGSLNRNSLIMPMICRLLPCPTFFPQLGPNFLSHFPLLSDFLSFSFFSSSLLHSISTPVELSCPFYFILCPIPTSSWR